MPKKPNKPQQFTKWVNANYPDKSSGIKQDVKSEFLYNQFREEILSFGFKGKNKKYNLFQYFLKLLKIKRLSEKKIKVQSDRSPYNKARNKIIKNAKGKIDVNSFYLTDKWLELKKKVHRLYNGVGCMKCKKEGVEKHIDHILPRSKYPQLELDIHNLQILCRDCNLEKSNNESIDYRTEEQKKLCSVKYA